MLVQRAREQLLPGAALAQQQHGGGGGRRLPDDVQGGPQRRALTDDGLLGPRQPGAELLVFQHQPPLVDRLLHALEHRVPLERLGEEVIGAVLHRRDRRLHRPVRGHQDHFRVGRDGAHGAQQLLPAHGRHHQIGEHHVDGLRAQPLHRLLAAAGEEDAIALAREDPVERIEVCLFVVDDEDGAAVLHAWIISAATLRRARSRTGARRTP